MCMGDAFSVPFILSCWKLLEKFEAKGKVNVCLLNAVVFVIIYNIYRALIPNGPKALRCRSNYFKQKFLENARIIIT